MSQFNYLASPKQIELGCYGSTRLYIDNVKIINDKKAIINDDIEIDAGILSFEGKTIDWFRKALLIFEDGIAAGIYVSNICAWASGIRDHFENKYVYMIELNTSSEETSNLCPEAAKAFEMDKETLVTLFKDLDIGEGFFELFSSWTEDEGEPRDKAKDMVMSLEALESLDYVTLEDRQYIRITV